MMFFYRFIFILFISSEWTLSGIEELNDATYFDGGREIHSDNECQKIIEDTYHKYLKKSADNRGQLINNIESFNQGNLNETFDEKFIYVGRQKARESRGKVARQIREIGDEHHPMSRINAVINAPYFAAKYVLDNIIWGNSKNKALPKT